ncbi:hypothetical protein M404DRAFT_993736 [Pisolithus tinctorius Marx 270]|uniref:Uncharacterized protein n=1 Tax=Pisolithus tinctorius Marx 270 TaxID=870435 RepID=A0A0C3PFS6_PISTI|nr:hypothetical protein M404DRAFT_993736 [Pisolithus tinctorius Marx 270]
MPLSPARGLEVAPSTDSGGNRDPVANLTRSRDISSSSSPPRDFGSNSFPPPFPLVSYNIFQRSLFPAPQPCFVCCLFVHG